MSEKIVFINGGTGFVGRALCSALLKENTHNLSCENNSCNTPLLAEQHFSIYVQTRMPSHHRHRYIKFVPSYSALPDDVNPDVIINLAGAPIADKRWTASRKRILRESRVSLTRSLFRAVEASKHSPVVINASAIGYYGCRGDEALTEDASSGEGFASQLCKDWENAALQFAELGSRVCVLRIGVVLGAGGGALAKMVPLFKLGLGGPIGSGKQWMSWIHLCDLVRLIASAITDDNYSGIINATAPEAVRQKEFATALGKALGRSAVIPTPALALRLVFGQMADELLVGGQRVSPRRATELGFKFCYPELSAALSEIQF